MKIRIKSNTKDYGQWQVQLKYKWWPFWFTLGYEFGTPEDVMAGVKTWLTPKTPTTIEMKL